VSGRSLNFCLALTVVTLLAFLPVFGNEFVNYDDDLYIQNVPEVAAGLSSDGWVWAFTSTQGANWFPLTRLSWMLDAELWGISPRAFHSTSLLLHVVASLLLFAAFRRLTGEVGASALLAGIFALHPLHVESVAWAAARKDVLCGVWFAVCLLAHERVARSERPVGWGVLLFVAAGLGLMAKPMLVTLPFVLLLLDIWPLGRLRRHGHWQRDGIRRAFVEKAPLFGLILVLSGVTLYAQRAGGAVQTLDAYPLWERAANAVDSIWWYVVDAVWPRGLSVFYPHPHRGVPLGRLAAAAAFLLGVSFLAFRQLDRRPYLWVGWAWFIGMLVPVLGLVQVGQAARADRYMYLPLIGLLIPFIWGALEAARGRPRFERALLPLGVIVLFVLGSTTLVQAQVWRSSQTLFRHALQVTDRNHVAHINFGLALFRDGEPERADRQLSRAISVMPSAAHAYGLRGEVRFEQGRYSEAAEDFRTARRIQPDSARWFLGQGRVAGKLHGPGKAVPMLRRALMLDPEDPMIQAQLGLALLDAGAVDAAIQSLRAALKRRQELEYKVGPSGVAIVYGHLGAALAREGQVGEALVQLDTSLRIDSENAAVYRERAILLDREGRETEAIASYREALVHGDRSAPLLNNLAWLLVSAREPGDRAPAEAVRLSEEAAQLTDRQEPSILDTLSVALAAEGRPEARKVALEALALADARGDVALARSIRDRIGSAPGD